MPHVLTGLVALFLASASVAEAQPRSLRELVTERQADIEVDTGCGIFSQPVRDTAATATVLVHGVIESVQARLSDDETKVMTEVTIRTIDVDRVFEGRNWSSPPEFMTLQTIGGVTAVDGHQVTHPMSKGWKVLPRDGLEVILLASRGTEPDQLLFDHYGAFAVEAGRVSPMGTLEVWPKRVLLDAFITDLRAVFGTQAAAIR